MCDICMGKTCGGMTKTQVQDHFYDCCKHKNGMSHERGNVGNLVLLMLIFCIPTCRLPLRMSENCYSFTLLARIN